jgi:hypothetical protein
MTAPKPCLAWSLVALAVALIVGGGGYTMTHAEWDFDACMAVMFGASLLLLVVDLPEGMPDTPARP